MKELTNNYVFLNSVISVAGISNSGKTTLLCNYADECLKDNKKVLFISLTNSSEIIKDKINNSQSENLIIYDKLLSNEKEISNLLSIYNPDIIMIDTINVFPSVEKALKMVRRLATFSMKIFIIAYEFPKDFEKNYKYIGKEFEIRINEDLYNLSDTIVVCDYPNDNKYYKRIK